MTADTLGHLTAVYVTPANERERTRVFDCARLYRRSGGTQSSWLGATRATREQLRQDARDHGIELQMTKLAEAKRVSCCCLRGGWVSAALSRQRVLADWSKTTSNLFLRSNDCTL
jgi:hypothetical protein